MRVDPRPLDLCTIVARNYLPYARVLADSFHEHHPEGRCHVLVLDGDGTPAADEGRPHLRLWGAEEAGIDGLRTLAAGYDVTELATAVKPAFLRRLLGGSARLLYLDPDIRIYAPLTPVLDALDEGPIVLNPHLASPLPADGERPNDHDILIAGAYNLGFLALRSDPRAAALLDWWEGHLRESCRVDLPAGLFVDQRWVDLVPGLFPATVVLRDPGCNVAYWNLPHREIADSGEGVLVDGAPLRFFHFSGFDPARPDRLSRHQTRPLVARRPVLRRLLREYAGEVRTARGAEAGEPYGFSRLPGGLALTFVVRAGHRRWRQEGGREDVFTPSGEEAFVRWLAAPQPGAPAGVNRYLHELRAARRDLRDAFDPEVGDVAEYLLWVHERGRVEVEIPERFLPPAPEGPAAVAVVARRRVHAVRHRLREGVGRLVLRATRR